MANNVTELLMAPRQCRRTDLVEIAGHYDITVNDRVCEITLPGSGGWAVSLPPVAEVVGEFVGIHIVADSGTGYATVSVNAADSPSENILGFGVQTFVGSFTLDDLDEYVILYSTGAHWLTLTWNK